MTSLFPPLAERNKLATKAVGIRGRSRPTLQHAGGTLELVLGTNDKVAIVSNTTTYTLSLGTGQTRSGANSRLAHYCSTDSPGAILPAGTLAIRLEICATRS